MKFAILLSILLFSTTVFAVYPTEMSLSCEKKIISKLDESFFLRTNPDKLQIMANLKKNWVVFPEENEFRQEQVLSGDFFYDVIVDKTNCEIIVRESTEEDMTKESYVQRFCLQYHQINKNLMGTMIKEMEGSPYKIEDYFEHKKCQTESYSIAVQSPMLHITVDDVWKHEEKLNTLWLYYSKKRKEPAIFTKIINVPNTYGETLLDFIEELSIRGAFGEEGLNGPVKRIVAMLCEHGGVYLASKDKSCPGDAVKKSWNQKICGKLLQINSSEMDLFIEEMIVSPYPIDDYFKHSECTLKWTPGGGNTSTHPMLHSLLENVKDNESKLDSIVDYYVVTRKRPDLLESAINLSSTGGAKLTMLDYVEFLKLQNRFTPEEIGGPVERIINKLCKNGGKYNYNYSCPKN